MAQNHADTSAINDINSYSIDRASGGSVTDFVKVPHWPAFNVADIAITLGVIALLIVVERDARATERQAAAHGSDGQR